MEKDIKMEEKEMVKDFIDTAINFARTRLDEVNILSLDLMTYQGLVAEMNEVSAVKVPINLGIVEYNGLKVEVVTIIPGNLNVVTISLRK